MALVERLRASARQASGDDSIVDVAEFHPRGSTAEVGSRQVKGRREWVELYRVLS